jgi:hypothetical protein
MQNPPLASRLSSSRALCAVALCLVVAGIANAQQAPLLAAAHSIAGGSLTTRVDPAEQTMTIGTAGTYNLTLTDLKTPAAFSEVTLAVTSGATLVGSATVTAGGSPGVAQINAQAGAYVVHVIGALASGQLFGTAGVQLTDTSGAPVSAFAGPGGSAVSGFTAALQLPPAPVPPNARVVDEMITLTADTYELDITDLQFPAALGAFSVNLVAPSGAPVPGFPLMLGGALKATFTAQAGSYHLVGATQAATGAIGGLFNIHAFSTTTHVDVVNETDALGMVVALGSTPSLSAGPYQLALSDFAFPKPLAQGAAVAVQGQSLVANTTGGSPASFTAVAGTAQLFALAVPDATAGNGAYGVTLAPQGGAQAFSAVRTASTGNGVSAYTFPVTITTAGSYTLTLVDFQFPGAFSTIEVAVAQNGALLGTPLAAAGTATLSPAAGQIYVLAATTPGTGGQGLFGVNLAPSGGGATALDVTQGVGAAFGTTTVSITAAGSYTVKLSDLGFPGNFSELGAVVTQGTTRLGSIFGGGKFNFAATTGDYIINVLGTPAAILTTSSQTAGTYGVSVAPTPPAPTVTLSSSASQVSSGGTVTLTWSSTNATACTATGGWSGALTTFGTQASSAITSSTTFTLGCTGDGGTTSQSVSVGVTPPSPGGKGGGGSVDVWLIALLTLGAVSRALDRGNKSVMYDI